MKSETPAFAMAQTAYTEECCVAADAYARSLLSDAPQGTASTAVLRSMHEFHKIKEEISPSLVGELMSAAQLVCDTIPPNYRDLQKVESLRGARVPGALYSPAVLDRLYTQIPEVRMDHIGQYLRAPRAGETACKYGDECVGKTYFPLGGTILRSFHLPERLHDQPLACFREPDCGSFEQPNQLATSTEAHEMQKALPVPRACFFCALRDTETCSRQCLQTRGTTLVAQFFRTCPLEFPQDGDKYHLVPIASDAAGNGMCFNGIVSPVIRFRADLADFNAAGKTFTLNYPVAAGEETEGEPDFKRRRVGTA